MKLHSVMVWVRARWPWLAGACVLLAAGTALMWWQLGSGPTNAEDRFAVHTGSEPTEQPAIDMVERTLSGLPMQLAAGNTESLTPQAKALNTPGALPAGTVLTVDRASWRRTGTVASVMVLASSSNETAGFLVVMVRQGDAWLVSQTYRQADS